MVATGGAAPGRVAAHADYDRSLPAAGATIPRAPERVEIWFTQQLFRREGANVIEVRDRSGARADTGDLVLDERDRTHLTIGLAPGLPPGSYAVSWQTLSAVDGDTARGSFDFTIDPDAPEAGAAERDAAPGRGADDAAPAATGGDSPWWILGVLAAIGASAALAARALLAPARATSDDPG